MATAGHRRVPGRSRLRADVTPASGQPGRHRLRHLGPAHRSKVLHVRQFLAHTRSALFDQRGKRKLSCLSLLSDFPRAHVRYIIIFSHHLSALANKSHILLLRRLLRRSQHNIANLSSSVGTRDVVIVLPCRSTNWPIIKFIWGREHYRSGFFSTTFNRSFG